MFLIELKPTTRYNSSKEPFWQSEVLTTHKIALDTFIDNIATLAIERILLRNLPDLILAGCDPSNLSDEQLEAVAGESAEVKDQREKAIHRIAALEGIIQTCRKYKGIAQSTPQKITPRSGNGATVSVRTPEPSLPEAKASTGAHVNTKAASVSAEEYEDASEVASKTQSPTTPRAARTGRQSEQHPPSPSSSLGSELRGSEWSGSASTPRTSPGNRSPGPGYQYNNATGSIALRPASQSSNNGTTSSFRSHVDLE